MKYDFLNKIELLPKLVEAGRSFLGLKEVPGKGYNPVIKRWAKDLDIEDIYKNDDESWCAVFVSWLCWYCKKPMVGTKYFLIRAASYLKWGEAVEVEDACLGDICIFKRPGGNHVGLLIAVTKVNNKISTLHILGGNQSNSVSIAEISAVRCIGVRRFYSIAKPESAKQYIVDSSGRLSANES